MTKYFFAVIFCLLLLGKVQAQELACEVVINSDRIQNVDRQVFVSMQNSIFEFMNNRRWTNDAYQLNERIKCKLFITMRESPEIGVFKANAQIVVSRPVYGTAYETTLLNYFDKDWVFEYTQAQPLYYAENNYTSNLASLLSFYAYIIIGMDNDSFSKLGGSSAYDRAVSIMNNVQAQANGNPGWQAFDDARSRYWLVTNLQDPQFEPFRQGLYAYHRLGLDLFAAKPDDGRKGVMTMVQNVKQVAQLRPGAAILRAFFEAKSNEMVNIFQKAAPADKQKVYAILTEVDPTNTSTYQPLLK